MRILAELSVDVSPVNNEAVVEEVRRVIARGVMMDDYSRMVQPYSAKVCDSILSSGYSIKYI